MEPFPVTERWRKTKTMPYVRTPHISLYYTSCGKGPPVVFLAGLSLDTGTWDELDGCLKDHCTLIKVDCRGSGNSDVPRGPYSIEDMAEDMRQFGIGTGIENAIVVGHSMGGFTALELARRKEKLVGGLVLVSTSPTGKPEALGMSPEVASAFNRKTGPLSEIVRENMEVGLGKRIWATNRQLVEREIEKRLERPPRGAGFMGQTEAANHFDVRGQLGDIAVPCCIVHGKEDNVAPVARAMELYRGIPNATIALLEDVGHFPQLEDPENLSLEIRRLSRQVTGVTKR
jgi:pimeloyl-ACP methyl ester carboxylesterase